MNSNIWLMFVTCFFKLHKPEFQNAQPLLISEVNLLLQHKVEQNEKSEDEKAMAELFQKTQEYCARFAKLKNNAAITRVRQ